MNYRIVLLILILFSVSLNAQHIENRKDYKLSKFLTEVFRNKKVYYNTYPERNGFTPVTPFVSKYPVSNFITDIFNSGDTVWFATGSGIMRTRDRFKNFEYYFGVSPFGNDDVSGFIVYNNVIVAATAIVTDIGGESVPTGTGIKVSTDYGKSWNSNPQPMDGINDTSIVYGSNVLYALPVIVPQQNLSYDIAVTRCKCDTSLKIIWITSFAGGLRKSTDYGQTWHRVLLPPDVLDSIYTGGTGYTFGLNPRDNLNHRAFSVEAVNDSVLFVGTANGINVSTDWGVSWRKWNFQNSGSGVNRVSGNFVVNFHIQEYGTKQIIWAATRKAEDLNEVSAISYTTNGGLNWSYTLSNIYPNNISSKDSIVYAQTNDGLWRSYFTTPFSWSKPPLIYDETTKDKLTTNSFYTGNNVGDTLYFGSADGLLRTIETGSPWTGKWKIFRAITPIDLSSDIKTYAAPNPFSPDDEMTRIFYKTGKNLAKITIKIFDFGMNPVRTLIQNATRITPDEIYTSWDGKNNDGYQVANGVYFYRIEIDNDKPEWGKILVLQ